MKRRREQSLSTGAVARLLNVSTDMVRYLERKGILPAERTPSGRREFTLKNVKRVGIARGVDVTKTSGDLT
jgi:DNA-binding transcriptional MerR regulator